MFWIRHKVFKYGITELAPIDTSMRDIKLQCGPHIGTSFYMTGFYMRATLAFNGSIKTFRCWSRKYREI